MRSTRMHSDALIFLGRRTIQVENHEPAWAKNLFVKEASWADHYSVMARTNLALDFDTVAEV